LTESTTGKRSAFEIGLMIAREKFEIIRSEEGDFYAVPREGPRIAVRTNHPSFRRKLVAAYTKYSKNKRSLSPLVVEQIIMNLEDDAELQMPTRIDLRYAEVEGITYVDLGDPFGRCVRASKDGWEVLSSAPVFFRRSPLTLPMPVPIPGTGDVDKIFDLMNIPEEKRPLLLAWLVSAFFPNDPHPIAHFDGEKGTGKSRSLFYCGATVDPNGAPLRKMPRDGERWVEAVLGGYFIPLDNLTTLTEEQSNQLCRASTGDSDVRRVKYTDDDLKVISYKRLVGINGISVLGIRDDLADRLIHFETQRISGYRRRTEAELQRHFDEHAPAILAGLLDLVVKVKQLLPGIQTQGLPRMADFAKIVIALDQLRGTNGYSEYLHDIDAHAQDVFTNEPFLILLRKAVTAPFEGDAAILHNRMIASLKVSDLPIPYEEIPRKPVWVTTKLKQHADTLRRAGWKVTNLGNRNRRKVTIWRLAPPAADEITSGQVPGPSQTDDTGRRNLVQFTHLSY